MNTAAGTALSAIVGLLLAAGASFGLVSSQSAAPPVVTAPFVTYDS